MLSLENLCKTYPGHGAAVQALTGVSLQVEAGQFVAIQGASGSGKSTLLLMAGGLLAPDSGTVMLDGQYPYAMSTAQRAKFRAEQIGFVFQQFHLVPYLSAWENILAPSVATHLNDPAGRARELLEHFGLTQRAQHVPAELSIGERQRVALARALLNRPKLLLADEPTGNLDADNSRIVIQHLQEFARSGGAVLLVTHDPLATRCADHVHILEQGRLQPATPALQAT